MIHLDRYELRDLARIFILANTPHTLRRGLEENGVVRRLMTDCTVDQLREYYDRITARARRSEIDLPIAYAVLMALLEKGAPVDSSHLEWGPAIEDYLRKARATTQSLIIPVRPPSVSQDQAIGSATSVSMRLSNIVDSR